jgi:hypothetical protein
MLAPFMSADVSFEVELGKIAQVFVRKKFKMDPSGSVLQLYVDLEKADKLDEVYEYIVLSAHFNRSTKQLVYSQSVVKHKSGALYVVLCVLRTKCIKPRYDVVVYRISDGLVFRLVGLTQFRKDYVYDPNQSFDPEACFEALKNFFAENEMFWDRLIPNKLETGAPDFDTWDPSMGKATLPTSGRGRGVSKDSPAVSGGKGAGGGKGGSGGNKTLPVRRGNRGGAGGRGSRGKKRKVIYDLASEDEEYASEVSDDEEEIMLKAQIKEKKKKQAKLAKLREQLAGLADNDVADEVNVADNKDVLPSGQVLSLASKTPAKNPSVFAVATPSTAMTPAAMTPAVMTTAVAATPASSTPPLTMLQMQIIQDQTKRLEHTHNLELKNQLYENLILSGQFKH